MAPALPLRLSTTLLRDGSHTFIHFPSRLLGTRARVRVKGTLNGHPFATSATPWRNEDHLITVNAGMRDRMGLAGGEPVDLVVERDESPLPELRPPADLLAALEARGGRATFDGLPPPHRSRFVALVEAPDAPRARSERIAHVVSKILSGADPFLPLRGTAKKDR